jgi:uncharacterized protein involved in exopolysaccharide biosynthesis
MGRSPVRARPLFLRPRTVVDEVHDRCPTQSRDAADAVRYLASQLAKIEDDITRLNQKLRLVTPVAIKSSLGGPRPSSELVKLEDAREQLADLLLRYTDAHPLVQEQKAEVAALEKQLDELVKKIRGRYRE